MNQPKVKYSLSNWDLVTVNPNYKTWNWKDMFCFWGVNIQSVIGFSLIASLYIVYDLNTLVVFFGTILGSFFVYLFSNLIGKPSQKFGLPFTVLLRSSLGFKGAEYFGLLRGLVGIFMFGVQTYFLSKAFGYLIRILIFSIDSSLLNKDIFLVFIIGIDIIDWISFTAVIIFQTLMFSIGINFNKRLINYSAITVYGGMLIFFFGVLLSDVKLTSQAFYELLDYKNLLVNDNIFALLTVAGSIFAYFSIIIVSFGDFSRYVKNEDELKKGNLSLIANLIIFSIFSVFIVIGSDVFLNLRFLDLSSILTNPTDIIGKFDNTLITVIAIFFIIISSASTNLVANFIPSQYSLINFLPNSLNLKRASYIILIISFFIGIFWLTVLSQIGILSFVDTFISFFGPLFGVMVADYYLIKSQSISNKDIYSTSADSIYYFSNGWHIKGCYSISIGFIFSASTIWNPNLMFLQSFGWIIGAFISSLTYYLLAKR
ncbi:cytosine permease [Candidatus Pelagibacter bacterium]|nr:cytosine permease [Candidatus Pelagibacter bacterium]MDB4065954.1 cytosine permease [Candidatus Pelagibacter sp.]